MSTFESVGRTQLSVWQRMLLSLLPHSATYIFLGLGILLLDLLTSQFLLPFILYVVPVGLAAWFARRSTAYALSLVLPVGSLCIVLFLEHSAPPHYAVMNFLIQIGVLVFIAFSAGTVRQNIDLKREVKLLESILPVCMGCRRIRDERQQWQHLEAYVTEHTDSIVSHGLCAECARRLYGEYMDDDPKV